MGPGVASGYRHVHLHDHARRAPSWTDMHAGTSAWLYPADENHFHDVELGKTLEAVWIHRPALMRAGPRNHSPVPNERTSLSACASHASTTSAFGGGA